MLAAGIDRKDAAKYARSFVSQEVKLELVGELSAQTLTELGISDKVNCTKILTHAGVAQEVRSKYLDVVEEEEVSWSDFDDDDEVQVEMAIGVEAYELDYPDWDSLVQISEPVGPPQNMQEISNVHQVQEKTPKESTIEAIIRTENTNEERKSKESPLDERSESPVNNNTDNSQASAVRPHKRDKIKYRSWSNNNSNKGLDRDRDRDRTNRPWRVKCDMTEEILMEGRIISEDKREP